MEMTTMPNLNSDGTKPMNNMFAELCDVITETHKKFKKEDIVLAEDDRGGYLLRIKEDPVIYFEDAWSAAFEMQAIIKVLDYIEHCDK